MTAARWTTPQTSPATLKTRPSAAGSVPVRPSSSPPPLPTPVRRVALGLSVGRRRLGGGQGVRCRNLGGRHGSPRSEYGPPVPLTWAGANLMGHPPWSVANRGCRERGRERGEGDVLRVLLHRMRGRRCHCSHSQVSLPSLPIPAWNRAIGSRVVGPGHLQ